MSIETTHVFVMARGLGSRLMPLTQNTCKPCVAFGAHRLIDFVLSNLHKSGFSSHSITVLGPPESSGLAHYLKKHWPLVNLDSIDISEPLNGNAKSVLNALRCNLDNNAAHIGVFSCDQVFHFDLRDSFQQYLQSNTNALLLAKWHPVSEASQFGIFHVQNQYAVSLLEKPKQIPKTYITNEQALINLGMYWFKRDHLFQTLLKDEQIETSSNDFGHDILPLWISNQRALVYEVDSAIPWADVGTIDQYWMTYWTYHDEIPRWNVQATQYEYIRHRHIVHETTDIRQCILFDNIEIGKSCLLSKLIILEGCVVEDNTVISNETHIQGLVYQGTHCRVIPPRCRVRYDKHTQTIISEPL